MTWLRPVALLLVLALLVSASRAATLCVEADGTVQVELVAAPCCDAEGSPPAPSAPEPGASLAPLNPGSGCDDRPLDEARWTRSSSSPAALLPAPTPCLAAAALPPPPPPALEPRERALAGGPPTPRAARPSVARP